MWHSLTIFYSECIFSRLSPFRIICGFFLEFFLFISKHCYSVTYRGLIYHTLSSYALMSCKLLSFSTIPLISNTFSASSNDPVCVCSTHKVTHAKEAQNNVPQLQQAFATARHGYPSQKWAIIPPKLPSLHHSPPQKSFHPVQSPMHSPPACLYVCFFLSLFCSPPHGWPPLHSICQDRPAGSITTLWTLNAAQQLVFKPIDLGNMLIVGWEISV